MCEVGDTVTASVENLQFVDETLDEPTRPTIDKIVGDVFKMGVECSKNAVKASETLSPDILHPASDVPYALTFSKRTLIDRRQRAEHRLNERAFTR